VDGYVLINNQRTSSFGAGWSLDGLQRLRKLEDGTLVVTEGNGSVLFFGGATSSHDDSVLAENRNGGVTRKLTDGTRIEFDPEGLHTTTVEPSGNTTSYTYDDTGRLATVVDPGGLPIAFRYGDDGLLSEIMDPDGRSTFFLHDANGDLRQIIDPDDSRREFDYDDRHLMLSERSERGDTRYHYDFAGRLERTDQPDGSSLVFPPETTVGLPDLRSGVGTPESPAPPVRLAGADGAVREGQTVRPDPATFSPPFPRLAMISLTESVASEWRSRLARYDLLILHRNFAPEVLEEVRMLGDPLIALVYFGSYYKTTGHPINWTEDPVLTVEANNWWLRKAYPDGPMVSDWPTTHFVNLTPLAQSGPDGYYNDWFPNWYYDTFLAPGAALQLDGIHYDNVFWNVYQQLYIYCEGSPPCQGNPPPCTCDPADFDADGIPDTDQEAIDNRFNSGMRALLENTRARFGDALWISGNSDGNGAYADLQNGAALEKFAQIYGENDYGNPFGYNYRWDYNMFSPEKGLWESKHRHYHRRMNPGVISWNAGWTLGNPQHTYDTPDRTPEFERDKRFKFASTLMTDAYFLFRQWATTTLWWEDEFANAGVEEGYLGYPEEPMQRLLSPTGPNRLPNGDFSDSLASWQVIHADEVSVSKEVVEGADPNGNHALHLNVSGTEGVNWHAQLRQNNSYTVLQDQPYTLRLYARSDEQRDVKIEFMTFFSAPVAHAGKLIRLTPEWREYTYSFIARHAVTNNGLLRLSFGDVDGDLWLSDVRLQDGHTYFFRRDFGKGVAFVNDTPSTEVVTLSTPMLKLTGSINPDYDGSEVTDVTVPPYDGVVLVKRPQDIDLDAPSVEITSPAMGAVITGAAVQVEATVLDASPVYRVVFYVDDTAAGAAFEPPYTYDLIRSRWGIGVHDLKAVAIDSAGNEAESAVVTVELRKPRGGKHPPAILADP
jgi:YD repeat-containing protein